MNTNQKTQPSSNTNTTNGQDRFVELTQGGALSRIYKNYMFDPLTESTWDRNIVKEYADIGKELTFILAKDKVVYLGSHWKKSVWLNEAFGGNGPRQSLLKMVEWLH